MQRGPSESDVRSPAKRLCELGLLKHFRCELGLLKHIRCEFPGGAGMPQDPVPKD